MKNEEILLAESGDKKAQYALANALYDKQEYEKAVFWYEKAAKQNHLDAQNNLGNCYYDGEGIERNYRKAVFWYRKAAEKNNSAAQFNLSNCYYHGKGVRKNLELKGS